MSKQLAERLRSDNRRWKEDEKGNTGSGGYKADFGGSPFLFKRGGVEIYLAALCCVPDLGQKVFQLLEQNER